ncbi:MAG TPA: glycosyltransferase [Gemmataceae bacterium]|nr:glycosyltransferase [Gemmataceae bacterium]
MKTAHPLTVAKALPSLLVFWVFWLGLVGVVVWCLPASVWSLKPHGLFLWLGFLGLARYGWQGLHAARAYYYRFVAFPRMRRAADRLGPRYPRRLFFVIPSYNEDYAVSCRCFTALVTECARLPSEVHVIATVGSAEEIASIEKIVRNCPGHEHVRVRFELQKDGKRKAIADALRTIATEFGPDLEQDDVIALMDGDTALGEHVLERTLPFFALNPGLGGLTTDEHPRVFHSAFLEKYFALKLMRRHHIMMSHSLSERVLTLTGRFSVVRAKLAVAPDFIDHVENDSIHTWLHGDIRFLMGDDKSTLYALLKDGWRTIYVPDAYIVCLEDREGSARLVSTLMMRWYGNMLRNNGRCLALGPRRVPPFIWLCLLDQRVAMWTSLAGPVSALLLSLLVSPYYGVFYLIWVVLARVAQLSLLAAYGHRFRIGHLPMLVFEQWWGSAIKIYCQFHLDRQVWQKSRKKAEVVATQPARFAGFESVVTAALFSSVVAGYVLLIGVWVRAIPHPWR